MIHEELKSMLKELIPCIKGNFFLGDGALLGIKRNNNLIPWDNDLDIYLLPDAYIDINEIKKTSLNFTSYYLCDKISRKKNEKIKTNTWREYNAYKRIFHTNLNRAEIMKLSSSTYQDNKLNISHTFPWIDIFYLKKENNIYKIKRYDWNLYFTEDEISSIDITKVLGFPVPVPYNCENILKRQYGEDWRTEKKDFQYN